MLRLFGEKSWVGPEPFLSYYSRIYSLSLDFYLVKFTEDGIKRVLSRDKVKIDGDDVETGSTCEAYWEDAQTKGWFQAIILAFGG